MKIIFYLLLFNICGFASGQDIDVNALRALLDRVKGFEGKWTMERNDAPDFDLAESQRKQWLERADAEKDPLKKKSLLDVAEKFHKNYSAAQIVKFSINAKVLDDAHYEITQRFEDPESPAEYSYFSDDDGFEMFVDKGNKAVEIRKPSTLVPFQLARGFPELYGKYFMSSKNLEVKKVEKVGDDLNLIADDGVRTLYMTISGARLNFSRILVSRSDHSSRRDEWNWPDDISEVHVLGELVASGFSLGEGGLEVPKEVVVRDFKSGDSEQVVSVEKWTLQSMSPLSDVDFSYQFQPGWIVKDSLGDKPKMFYSDDVLKK